MGSRSAAPRSAASRSPASRSWAPRWAAPRWAAPRWPVLGVAIVILVLFLLAQRQSVEVSYGDSPSSVGIAEGAGGELSDATVPSPVEMTALVEANPVVRLPGSVASWDEPRVRTAIGDSGYRILVAPPGLDQAERDRVYAVDSATIRVIGTAVSGGAYLASPDTLAGWCAQLASGDVTGPLLTLIAGLQHRPGPPDVDQRRWRDPTAAELARVAADLRASGLHRAPGATLTAVPRPAGTAFPDSEALYVALPRQQFGAPLPRYGSALTRLFPDTPIVVLYGSWVEYHGPRSDRFAEVAGASFYGQLGDRLARYDYPQDNVLGAYLGRVTDVRYAGLFDRPLPYRAVDPVRVALPALPWLFAACVAVFLALSARSLPRLPGRTGTRPGRQGSSPGGTPTRLAGLTTLAVEMSALTDERADPALVRGITALRSAREALADGLPDRQVRALVDGAEAELDAAARLLPFAGYRPAEYLPDVYLRDDLPPGGTARGGTARGGAT